MNNIKRLILDNQSRISKLNLIERDIDIDTSVVQNLNKVVTISGPRRAGKTFFMLQIIKKLKLDFEDIVFIDFSEILFLDFTAKDFPMLYSSYLELFPNRTPFFFLDEIQEIESFEKGVKYLQNRGLKVFIIGSSAKLFSQDIASILRGKTYTIKVPTLNFSEYLRFIGVKSTKVITTKYSAKLKNYFNDFLKTGGFPEIVLTNNQETRRNLIKSYIDIMLFRDIIERHSIKNSNVVELVFKKLISSFTKEISINKWFNDFKSSGIKVSKQTLFEYVKYFEDTQFIRLLANRNGGATSQKKAFLVDNGLQSILFSLSQNFGKLFENLILNDLIRKGKEVYFLKDKGLEVDFIFDDIAIQVCHTLNDSNIEREVEGLKLAMKQNYIKKGILLYVFDERIDNTNYVLPNSCNVLEYESFQDNI